MESTTTAPLAISGVSHIELFVSDLDASVEWYRTVCGMIEIGAAPGRYSQLVPEAGGFRLGLTAKRTEDMTPSFGHLAIAVESLDVLHDWIRHLDAIGAEHTPIRENPYKAGVWSIDVFDPDGHEIELIFEPEGAYYTPPPR